MISILTYQEDQTTQHVIDWINYNNELFSIIVPENFFYSQALHISNINNVEIKNNPFWFRKWKLPNKTNDKESFLMILNAFVNQNKTNFWINKPMDMFIGKGAQLQTAYSCGFKIPNTVITMNKEAIKAFLLENERSIIKLNNITSDKIKNNKLNYTQLLTTKDIDSLEINEPCIIQEYIDKEIEIRTFFLDGNCHSMAIFSQNDDRTKIDYRNYNFNQPNRNVPIKLPEKIEDQILLLMKKLEMNSGSLDIILTPKGEFVFLEVNPVGQFEMVSYPCNYQLEKKVANLLIKYN